MNISRFKLGINESITIANNYDHEIFVEVELIDVLEQKRLTFERVRKIIDEIL